MLTIYTGILSVLLADRIYFFYSAKKDKNEILKRFDRVVADTSSTSMFKDQYVAMEYLLSNIPRANHILNTRLHTKTIDSVSKKMLRLREEHDDLIFAAIVKGCHYRLVYSDEYQEEINQFASKFKDVDEGKGDFLSYKVCTHALPLIQMIILDYGNEEKEALIGWIGVSPSDNDRRVFMIRSKSLVDYFREVFDMYVNLSNRVNNI